MRIFCLLFLFILPFAYKAIAANGDTTWIQANSKRLTYYNNYDTAVAFPSGQKSYRKILMYFTLGKYQCPGYNPNNPGEISNGGTGWCGDWDYTVQNFVITKTGDVAELGRLITPYANTNWPRTPWTWRQPYVFDVSDYYPLLKDSATIRILYSGYSGGFTANIRFAFIEGTPERNVVGLQRIWGGSFDYGHGNIPINNRLDTLFITPPLNALTSEVKVNITGHGGDDSSCAEFCPNTFTLKLDNALVANQNFFRTTCGNNNLYPQSGTWIYDRANWCPGEQVRSYRYPLAGATPGQTANLAMTFPPYVSTTNGGGNAALYTIDGTVFYYGPYNKNLDASIEEIVAPNNDPRFYKNNPSAGAPIVRVRNTGATTITSIRFDYQVDGSTVQSYTSEDTITSGNTKAITLDTLQTMPFFTGVHTFKVKIGNVNAAIDEDSTNNMRSSNFAAISSWPNKFVIQFKADASGTELNPAICQTAWRVEDLEGNIIKQKNNCPISTLCKDTVQLAVGHIYRFVVTDTAVYGFYNIKKGQTVGEPGGDGLRGFTNSIGYIRLNKFGSTVKISVPSAGINYFEGNFGGGFMQYFYTSDIAATNPTLIQTTHLDAFPNPASQNLTVDLEGAKPGVLVLTDMVGKVVLTKPSFSGENELDLKAVTPGIYLLRYQCTVGNGEMRQTRVEVIR